MTSIAKPSAANVAAFCRFCSVLSIACRNAGDLYLPEYAVLADVCAAQEEGVPFKTLEQHFGFSDDITHLVHELEVRELVSRQRSTTDRRAHVCVATSKGRVRQECVDDAIVIALTANNPKMNDEILQDLAAQFQAFDRAANPDHHGRSFLPPTMLSVLCLCRRSVITHGAALGLTSVQLGIMSSCDARGSAVDAGYIAQLFDFSPQFAAYQLDHLSDRGLLYGDGTYELSEEGLRRIDLFNEMFAESLDESFAFLDDETRKKLRLFNGYLTYLFS